MPATRTEPFVPLTAAATRPGETTEYRVNLVSQPGPTQSFKPLAAEASAASHDTAIHAKKNCDPRVSIQREGDQVTGIRIHCGCGQVIDLACIY